ncbi:UNVERIFIED_CONTAM: hypothetical protein HDU68_003227 [Siphonaria sp. JEL0065]|nr:hypothetical protein HDU68_003227 [Siphonaria sp. JEL0065]
MTATSRSSVCNHLLALPDLSEAIDESTWFISHVWEYNFIDVLDALKRFFFAKQIPLDEAVVWFDLFSVSQHDSEELKAEWWKSSMKSIKNNKNLVLVVQDWLDPTPLTRSWFSLEMFCATSGRLSFHIATTETTDITLANLLLQDIEAIFNVFSTFKSEYGISAKPQDQQMISRLLRHYIEPRKLNELVISILNNSIIEFVDSQISSTPFLTDLAALLRLSQWYEVKSRIYELLNMLDKAKDALSECLSLRDEFLGSTHPITLQTKSHYAFLADQLGETDFAEMMLFSCLESQRETLGSRHPDALMTMSRLALVYGRQSLFGQSEKLYLEYFASSVVGIIDKSIISTKQDWAHLYLATGRYLDAKALYAETYNFSQLNFGVHDKTTLFCGLGLAEVNRKLDNFVDAEILYTGISDSIKNVFGENSLQYWTARIGLALSWKETGRLDDALELLTLISAEEKSSVGPNHPLTLETNIHLAQVYADLESVKAEALFVGNLAGLRGMAGTKHRSTLFAIRSLATFYAKEGRFLEALRLYKEYYEIQVVNAGADHFESLSAQYSIAITYFRIGNTSHAHTVLSNYHIKRRDSPPEIFHKPSIDVLENDLQMIQQMML